ncbi:MAG TPA: multidrug ABC transporter ATP-binding protein [Morganella sp. (in: Bacteria)]|nr:multidrug ABC transporter ATP-binding protein [Morganella sp. (in: enterobacteria)]
MRISINQVKKSFRGMSRPALAGITATIERGSVVGLIGPDGAGKTTLMRILAGLYKADNGCVIIEDSNGEKLIAGIDANIGYMPQKFGLYEDLTIEENMTFYADLAGVSGDSRDKLFNKLLLLTQLAAFTDRPAGKLSGGMKQKLGLACVLLSEPDILLLDEPGVGVDPIARRELWEMVHALAAQGMLIVWGTSYLDEAEKCDNIILLHEGELLYRGCPQSLTESMAERSFLMAVPAHSRRTQLQTAILCPDVSDAVCQGSYIRLIVKKNTDTSVLMAALGQPAGMLRSVAPRFEDAFIDLLGGGPSEPSRLAEFMTPISTELKETVIEAKQLTKRYGSFTATSDINFSVKRGEIFGLLGPNGAGKSTTFKMMCGLQSVTDGAALVLGQDLSITSGKIRQHLGYMAQKFSLYEHLTVRQNLDFFSGIYGLYGHTKQSAIQNMIHIFAFEPILSQKTGQLPMGFKQRLALACALMHEPDILFLDEPTSGVDPITRREFWLHINGMVNKGVTVMVTTHFLEEAEYCDRIGLVYRGQMIALGEPDDFKKQVITPELPDPSMEDAFINLVLNYDKKQQRQNGEY